MQAAQLPASSLHWKVLPLSLEVNATDALVAVPLDGAEVIVVFGGVVSAGAEIVHVALAGVASVLPAASVARTSNVCDPTASPV